MLLAEAEHADDALARADANVRAFPGDVWTRVHAGDVHRSLADHEHAEREYRHAAALAQAHGDRHDVAAVAQCLAELLANLPAGA